MPTRCSTTNEPNPNPHTPNQISTKMGSFRIFSLQPRKHADLTFPTPFAILKSHGRGAAAISSRAVFRLRFGCPAQRGRLNIPPKPPGHRKPSRLGSRAKTRSLSLVLRVERYREIRSLRDGLPPVAPPICI